MKLLVPILLMMLAAAGAASAQTFYGTDDAGRFREGRDREFRDKAESPLPVEEFGKFEGLKYFSLDQGYRVDAKFRRTADEQYFLMPTSSGRLKKFIKYGELAFKIGGRRLKLAVYQIDPLIREKFPEYADLLFIPFRDRTNGNETYGGGRYIDIRIPDGERVTLDFNLAYNPNCAYGSDRYNCPIPPKENSLPVGIRAGEKRYLTDSGNAGH